MRLAGDGRRPAACNAPLVEPMPVRIPAEMVCIRDSKPQASLRASTQPSLKYP
jgi:hypothetical protein